MKKIAYTLILCVILFNGIVSAVYTNLSTETFGTKADVSSTSTFTNLNTLTFGTKAEVDDIGISFTQINVLTFGTKADIYPIILSTIPSDDATDIDMYPLLYVTIEHDTTEEMNITWSTNYTDWVKTTDHVHSGTYSKRADFVNQSETKFWWNVNVTDQYGNYYNRTYSFTTRSYAWTTWSPIWSFNYSGNIPEATNFLPVNRNITVTRGAVRLSVDCNDSDGDTMNVSFYWADNSTLIGQNLSINNGTYTQDINVKYLQRVNWSVNLNDGIHWHNTTLTFKGQNLSNVSHLVVTRINSNTVNLTWTKTSNITNTYIIYKFDSAPTNRGDGTFLKDTTNSYFNHTTVGYGTHIYYGLWSYNATDDVYSIRFKTGDNYTNPGSPTSLQDTGSSMSSISMEWDIGTNATRSVVFMNQTGIANYPDRSNGVEKINTTGNTGTANGLDANITYWFSVYSYNPDSGLWGDSNSTDNATTAAAAGDISSFTANQFNDVQINLSWNKANPSDDVLIRRKTSGYPNNPTDGNLVYNGSLYTYKDTGLTPSSRYYYKAWTWNGDEYGSTPAIDIQRTRPSIPIDFTGDIDSGNLIISWNYGTGATRTIIRNNTGVYPSSPTDGTEVGNFTLPTTETTVTGTSSIDYYRAWSYKVVYGEPTYSLPVDLIWGGLEVNVYSEDKPWIEIGNYTVFITNNDATESYYNATVNNPFRIDVSDVPNGEDITVQISKDGYKTRSQVFDMFENVYYTRSFYLPASSEGSPDSETGEDWYVPPIEDETDLQSTTETVVDYTTDETVIATCVIGEINAVYVYNDSLYGGWREVGNDNYSYTGHTVTIDSDALDVNSSTIKVEYYCSYSERYSEHYILQVIDERQQPVSDAVITISRYINTTDQYEDMYIIRTDSNGQQSVDLIPDIIYHVVITHDDYTTDISDWSPPVVEYEADISKVFVLEFEDVQPSQPDNPVEKININVELSSNSIWVNYTDDTSLTSSLYITIYETNSSTNNYALWKSYSYNPVGYFNTVSYEFTNVNTSNIYSVYVQYNHSYYGFSPQTWGPYVIQTFRNVSSNVNLIIENLFGWNPFGWHNFIMWIIVIIGFMSIDERDSGIFLIIIGGIIIFINFVVGFHTGLAVVGGGIIPSLIILFGIISMWNKKGKRY